MTLVSHLLFFPMHENNCSSSRMGTQMTDLNQPAIPVSVSSSESNLDFDATLSNAIRGIQYSISTLYDSSQVQFEKFLKNFFIEKDGVLISRNINVNISGSISSIPIITLFPTNFMELSKVIIEYEGNVIAINPKIDSMDRKRSSFVLKKDADNKPIKISTEFQTSEQTESYKRMIEKFTNLSINHAN